MVLSTGLFHHSGTRPHSGDTFSMSFSAIDAFVDFLTMHFAAKGHRSELHPSSPHTELRR